MSSQWNTRHTLIQRAQNSDDSETWEEFVSYYHRFIFYILNQMNVPQTIIDDLAQEVLLNLWSKLDLYMKEKGRFRTWLASVTRNTAIDNLIKDERYKRRQHDATVALEVMQKVSESDFEKLIEHEWQAHLGSLALERVEKVFAHNAIDVFKMSLAHKSVDEIAEALNLTTGSVYTLKARVKSKFKRELKLLMYELEF